MLVAAGSSIARYYLGQLMQAEVSSLIYIPAIALAAWIGGFWPGLLATALTTAADLYLRYDPNRGISAIAAPDVQLRVLLLLGTGLLISSLYAAVRHARRMAEQRLRRARLMAEAGQRLSGTLVKEEIYDGLRELIGRALSYDGMIVSTYDAVTRRVRCVYGWVNGRPFDHGSLPPLTIDLKGPGMQTEVIRSGEARLYADVRERVRRPGRYYDVEPDGTVRDLTTPGAEPPGAQCALMAPIKLEGNVVGTVQVMSDDRCVYTTEHLGTLESIVAPMALALQNADLYARANREIEERIRIEQALTQSEDRLLDADRRKDEFLATLAHELRNPLAPIRNAVALLRADEPERSKLGWCREVIERQVGHMARLLDDLLDVSRISRGTLRLRLQGVELSEVVRHAAEASHPLMEAGRHNLTITLPPEPIMLEADATRLAQVFANLLNNAARYSETGSTIDVTAERRGSQAVVQVRDNGIGISGEMLPRIFEPFLQIDRSLERSQGGLGIGLALVKQVVEIHGGQVEVHSGGIGQGSVFTVRLPLPATPLAVRPEHVEDRPAEVASHARRRILVADDLPDSVDSLALMLERQGHEVRIAYDGLQAVGMARVFQPEVVLLDIAMPKLNGYEAARRIREDAGANVPLLIALTGWGHDENRQRTKEAGFDHHLVKPVDPEELSKLLSAGAATESAREGLR